MKTLSAPLLVLLPLLLGQADPPATPAKPDSALQWDAPTTNEDGTPLTDLAGYVVAISNPTADLNAGGAFLAQADAPGASTVEQPLAQLVSGLQDGTYLLWVLAYDLAGNRSKWSAPLPIRLDSRVPSPPSGARIKITVIVEIGQ